MTSFNFVNFKAFGDLVISANCLSRIGNEFGDNRVKMLIGHHLTELWNAISCPLEGEVLIHAEFGVPSVYDVRKNGVSRAIQSYLSLRKGLQLRSGSPNEVLVFDKWSLRERYLSRGTQAMALPVGCANIYLAYAAFWGLDALPNNHRDLAPSDRPRRLAIFPSARMSERVLPIPLIERTCKLAEANGVNVEIVLIEDELPDHKAHFVNARVLPREFGLLVNAMRGYTHIISADSLTAHLAEYLSKPVFVLSPIPKEYWLPYSSYIHDRWALFDGPIALTENALVDFVSF